MIGAILNKIMSNKQCEEDRVCLRDIKVLEATMRRSEGETARFSNNAETKNASTKVETLREAEPRPAIALALSVFDNITNICHLCNPQLPSRKHVKSRR